MGLERQRKRPYRAHTPDARADTGQCLQAAASVDFAHAHTDLVWPTVRRHANEMDDAVMRQHIALYVNDFTRDYGVEGTAAIDHLLTTAERLGIVPRSTGSLYSRHDD